MEINKKVIAQLNPCKNRFDNFLKYYSEFDGDLRGFLELENIPYDDKVWLFAKLATKKQIITWAALCAESVLFLFEERFLNDKRPRRAVEAVLNGELTEEIKNAARDSVKSVTSARHISYGAYYSAESAVSATYSYDTVFAIYAASNAHCAAAASAIDGTASSARQSQQDYNLLMMMEVV